MLWPTWPYHGPRPKIIMPIGVFLWGPFCKKMDLIGWREVVPSSNKKVTHTILEVYLGCGWRTKIHFVVHHTSKNSRLVLFISHHLTPPPPSTFSLVPFFQVLSMLLPHLHQLPNSPLHPSLPCSLLPTALTLHLNSRRAPLFPTPNTTSINLSSASFSRIWNCHHSTRKKCWMEG